MDDEGVGNRFSDATVAAARPLLVAPHPRAWMGGHVGERRRSEFPHAATVTVITNLPPPTRVLLSVTGLSPSGEEKCHEQWTMRRLE